MPRTLRWRLAAWLTLLTAVTFAVTFVAVYRGTASAVSRQIDSEIEGDMHALAETVTSARATSPAALAAAASSYVRNQPFSASSTLLFALVPGATTATNQPELLNSHARADSGESEAEQTRENRSAAALAAARDGLSTVVLPDVGRLRLLRERVAVRLAAAAPGHAGRARAVTVSLGVGESLATVAHAQAGVARAFILAAAIVLAGTLLAAYVLGTRLSAPLRRLAAVASRVDAGDLRPRVHDVESTGDEVRVLADAFNHMLDRLTEAFAAQRAFVADASHELRTPLTVMRGQLELLLSQGPSSAETRRVASLLEGEIARISRLVDDLLLLAKSERSELLRIDQLELVPYVKGLWEGATLLGERRFELGALPSGTLRADGDRLAQALRNLLANAVEHTRAPDGLVRLTLETVQRRGEEWLRFVVEDDGPGIPVDMREQVFGRFQRTDSARARNTGGAGLGLAIVRAIAQSHGGAVAAGTSPERGARMTLELPGFTPAPAGERSDRESGSARLSSPRRVGRGTPAAPRSASRRSAS